MSIVDPRLVPCMAMVLGIDEFMSECRALTNLCGNGVACVVVSRWENQLDAAQMRVALAHPNAAGDIQLPPPSD